MTDVATPEDLAAAIEAAGTLTSPEWARVFRTVPRGDYAPRFWHWRQHGQDTSQVLLDADDPATADEWRDVVNGDHAIVTHRGPAGEPISSSTQPSLMAQMLETLAVGDGIRVLEVGTGTGYNAALLCERLGSTLVTSIEVDALVASEARESLRRAGYRPNLVVGDGLLGCEDHAPYDRVMGTCSTGRVPAAWIRQTWPGGIILANVGQGMVKLVVSADNESASGRYLPGLSAFIQARHVDGVPPLTAEETIALCGGDGARSAGTVDKVLENDVFGAFLQLHLPSLTTVVAWPTGSPASRDYLYADAATGSWACASTTGGVRQGGTGRLFDRIGEVRQRWIDLGSPAHHRIGITAHADGRHTVWVDEPNPHEFALSPL